MDFYVHIDHAMNPTAELADIVLPSAVFWEIGRIGYPMAFEGNKWALQWREPVSEPLGESRDELWIICEIAKRLGYSDQFWSGNIDVAFEEMLRPMGYRLADLKNSKGPIFIQGQEDYQKYLQKGFDGVTGRIEIFSQVLKNIGQAPLPQWKNPLDLFDDCGIDRSRYPFLLTNAKLREYCQSQHRNVPSLRKKNPHPFVEINTGKAKSLNINDGDRVILETVVGRITMQAKHSDDIASNVLCTQHGWWQECPELGLSGHNIYSENGSNVNLLYSDDFEDPISGSLHIRGFPCNIINDESSFYSEVIG